ncbi:MAG: hypothetical protein HC911_16265 [Chloroflexaceae bacterium]|nr:hypothetical protein [Chloroflexaceae bacterium]
MSGAMWGWVGAIVGTVLGVLGGAVGTYASIKNTAGPRSRAYMIRLSVIMWIAIILFLVLLLLLPQPYNLLLWVPYGIALPLAIRTGNRRLAELTQLDRAEQHDAR